MASARSARSRDAWLASDPPYGERPALFGIAQGLAIVAVKTNPQAKPPHTGISLILVEDGLNREDDAVGFALATLAASEIRVAAVSEMPGYAERARVEMRI